MWRLTPPSAALYQEGVHGDPFRLVPHRRAGRGRAGRVREQALCFLRTIGFVELAEAGGLLAYRVNFIALYRRAAYFVDRILKGTKPASLHVEQPTTFDMVVNMKTAKALGIKIPQSVLVRATKVIE